MVKIARRDKVRSQGHHTMARLRIPAYLAAARVTARAAAVTLLLLVLVLRGLRLRLRLRLRLLFAVLRGRKWGKEKVKT